MDRVELQTRGIMTDDIHYTDGALGCALSHVALWREVADGTRPLTVCEDDAVLADDFVAVSRARLAALPDDWDIVLWGWNFDSLLVFHVLPGKPAMLVHGDGVVSAERFAAASQAPASPQLFRLERACGTLCYTVSPMGAARLLAHCLPLRRLPLAIQEAGVIWPNCGIDMMMSALYPRLGAYVSIPPLAMSPNLAASSTTRQPAPTGLLGRLAGLSLVDLVGEIDHLGGGADPLVEAAIYHAWIEANGASDLLFAAWFNIGVVLARAGDPGNAIIACRNVLVLKPDFQPAASHLELLLRPA